MPPSSDTDAKMRCVPLPPAQPEVPRPPYSCGWHEPAVASSPSRLASTSEAVYRTCTRAMHAEHAPLSEHDAMGRLMLQMTA